MGVSRQACVRIMRGGGGGWHKTLVLGCLPLAAPIGLSPLLILTFCGPERVLVVSTEALDDLSGLTTAGVGRPGDGLLPVPLTRCIQMHTPSPCLGLPTPAPTCVRWGLHLQDSFPDNGGGGVNWTAPRRTPTPDHGGATTTGPDATYPPAICQNLAGGGRSWGGGPAGGRGGGVKLGVGGGSSWGSGGGPAEGRGGGLAGGQGGVQPGVRGGGG